MAEEIKEKKVKVRFGEDIQNALTGKMFKKGSTEDVSEEQLKHWVRKGVLVEIAK